ncbi:unnamed protein product [Fraxinus pennsylvanica]|uniref:Uncharacterized protein n=1 Tax=Fraxinus pennsylvanica TaxID=56036 RepID=A0AAD2DPR3_9LAMI|nr:unnamed protein product [Fraxinus pennsylvanica]
MQMDDSDSKLEGNWVLVLNRKRNWSQLLWPRHIHNPLDAFAEGEDEVKRQENAKIESNGEIQDVDVQQMLIPSVVEKILVELEESTRTGIFVAYDNDLIGILVVADALKGGVVVVVEGLMKIRVNLIMVMDDNWRTAQAITKEKGGEIVRERETNAILIQPGDVFKVILDSKMPVDEYAFQNQIEEDENGHPIDEGKKFEKELRLEDMIPGEDATYESEEEYNETDDSNLWTRVSDLGLKLQKLKTNPWLSEHKHESSSFPKHI